MLGLFTFCLKKEKIKKKTIEVGQEQSRHDIIGAWHPNYIDKWGSFHANFRRKSLIPRAIQN